MSGTLEITEVDPSDPIMFTAQGMVSSLGLDAATSCAAARAGLRRAQQIDCLRFASLDGRSVEPATGHPVPIITHGFEGAPRLAQLAVAALRDLTGQFSTPVGARVGLYISMPSCRRHLTGAELIPDPVAKQSFLEQADEARLGLDDHIWTDRVLALTMQHIGLIKNTSLRFATYAGHTGFAEALAVAVRELQRNDVDLALVGGIDSLIDEPSLKWLKLTGRLKGEANPIGLEPGESAAFLAVERERSINRPMVPVLSRIQRIATAEEGGSRLLGQQVTGKALSDCVRAMTDTSETLWLLTDHNGETARAMEFGNVLARVAGPTRGMAPALFPAASFGDTGAASGGIAACLAHSAFMRNYAPADAAVVASVADGSQRSAFSIARC
jgi:3-oxoacyl-[acyl-carrier-protein] synthase-1